MNRVRSYLAILRGSYMVGMIYRFGFLFTILGNIVYMGVSYYLWRSIYAGAETLRGLTFDETFLYVALGSAVFILLKTYADWLLLQQRPDGSFPRRWKAGSNEPEEPSGTTSYAPVPLLVLMSEETGEALIARRRLALFESLDAGCS